MSIRAWIVILLFVLWSAATVSAQDTHELSKMAMQAAQIAKPDLVTTPDIFWERLRPTRLSNLTCPLVEGTDLGREVRPYIMTIRYPDANYVIYIAEDGSLAQPCDPKFGSLASVVPPTQTPLPTLTMSTTPTTPTLTFTPTMTLTPAPTATPLPDAFRCPPDFNGFLQPRIAVGRATTRVGDGGSPNRLRDEPSVSGEQIGQIQPGRTINQVLGGPACSDTYVWWRVEMDGIEAWTVESDSSDGGSYFLEPLEGVVFATTVPIAATATPEIAVATSTSEIVVATTMPEIVVTPSLETVPGLLYTIDLGEAFAYELQFASEDRLIVQSTNMLHVWTITGAETGLQEIPNVMSFDQTQDTLYGLSWSENEIYIAKKASLRDVTTIPMPALNTAATASSLSMTRDGRYFLTGGCNNADCTQGKIELWETATGTLLRSQPAHTGQARAWFTPDDTRILSMSLDGFQVWDTHTGAFLGSAAVPVEWNRYVLPVISSDSAYYYTPICTQRLSDFDCVEGKLQLRGWSIETSEQVTMADIPIPTPGLMNTQYSLAISPDGLHLASSFGDGLIQFWLLDPVTHALVQDKTLSVAATDGDEFDRTVTALAFNADGTKIAVALGSGVVQIREVPQP